MTSKNHSIGTPKQQAYIERLARETGYADDDVSATLRWLHEEQGSRRASSSMLSREGLSAAMASEVIDFLQGWAEPASAVEAETPAKSDPIEEYLASRPSNAAKLRAAVAILESITGQGSDPYVCAQAGIAGIDSRRR